ncbi:MAG: hypothetical protein Kow00103_08640 [Candidatus Caldatribacteriota bacterium]
MSNTIEDKISIFTKVINERIEHDFQEKQKQLVDYYENRIKGLIKEYEEKKKADIEKIIKDEQSRKQGIISKNKSSMRLQILRKRQEFVEKIKKEVEKRIKDLVKSNEYNLFLEKAIKKVLVYFSEEKLVYLKFSKSDYQDKQETILKTIQALRSENTYKIEIDDHLLGGVFAKSDKGKLEVDFTINTILEENDKLIAQILFSYLSKEN